MDSLYFTTTFSEKKYGIGAVIGGFLIHLTLGNLYSFGNMMTYMDSFMNQRIDSNVTYINFIWVNAIATGTQGLFMALSGILEKNVGPKITCLTGSIILSSGIAVTYFAVQSSLFAVIFTYGFLVGLGISLSYVTPLACGMMWFPEKKGLVNGIIVGGFGLGALGSTTLQTLYLNPDNISVGKSGYFEDVDVLNRVPSVFILLAVIFFVMQIIGCVLISKPKKNQNLLKQNILQVESEFLLNDEEEELNLQSDPKEDCTASEMIKRKEFYLFWFIYLFNTIAIGYINAMYKSFGQTFISNDLFLAQVGSFAAIFNFLGRIAWGRLMDRTSFKISMALLTLILALAFFSLPLTPYLGKAAFAIWIWVIFFTFSGTFVLMPTVIEKAFGSRFYSSNYGLIFTCQVVSGPLLAGVNQSVLHMFGYTGCFLTIGTIIVGSSLLTCFVPKNL